MAGRFGLVQKQNGSRVPLESINIQVDVQGFTAHVLATMKYTNKDENPIEAIYIFPLDEQAAVCGFQATIDGRTIVAEVQEKQEARDTYDDAISSGQSAFLLEESDESSDIFQISVGNLPPKKEAIVELRFVTELAVEAEGRVVFVLPTVLNPRYSPQESGASLSAQVPRVAAVDSPYSFEFEMKVKAISAISEISSSSNSLKIEIDGNDQTQAKVTLAEAHQFNKDVVVHILTREPFKPQAIVENGAKIEGKEDKDGFMASPVVMLNFFPEFKSSESSEKGEFVFVVDRSGSMSGSKNNSARETLLLFLKSLPDGCYFNVVGFGSSYTTLFKKSQLYNDENLKEATKLAETMQADLGGTEILRPLEWVFSQPLVKGHPRQLFLLTDGEVGNTQQVINLVQKHSNNARCFTFGIGSGASTALVKGVARAGKGTAEFVTAQEDRLQSKVIKTLRRALQPFISDVSIAWNLASGWTVQQIPSSLPPLFSGDRLVLYGVLKGSQNANKSGVSEVRLQGLLRKDEKMEHLIKFSTTHVDVENKENVLLHQLAAKSFIQEKQDGHNERREGGQEFEEAKTVIISISKSANVVSKFTSFVAVDQDSHQPVSGPLQKHVVPLYQKPVSMSMAICNYAAVRKGSRKRKRSSEGFFSSPNAPPPRSAAFCFGGGNAAAFAPPPSQAVCFGGGNAAGFAPPPPPAVCFGGGNAGAFAPFRENASTSAGALFGGFQGGLAKSSCPPPAPSGMSQKTKECPVAMSVISLQKASGSWEFTDQLVSLCGASRDALTKGCPKEIAVDTGEGKLLWATALALVLLMGKFLDQKDEWEMIAEKGTKWMKKNLPAGVTYESVMKAAAIEVGVQINPAQ
ncbi:hypothetical protein ACROYT_G042429 [Oculina patagonica]